MRSKITAVLVGVLLALGLTLTATPAQAAGWQVAYSTCCSPAYSTAVLSGGAWYTFTSGDLRNSVTRIRVPAHRCVFWKFYGSTLQQKNCNGGSTNTSFAVNDDTFILNVTAG